METHLESGIKEKGCGASQMLRHLPGIPLLGASWNKPTPGRQDKQEELEAPEQVRHEGSQGKQIFFSKNSELLQLIVSHELFNEKGTRPLKQTLQSKLLPPLHFLHDE